jgi:ribose/xylose/arabinose/galactoside ABC-type transport system permease subunit
MSIDLDQTGQDLRLPIPCADKTGSPSFNALIDHRNPLRIPGALLLGLVIFFSVFANGFAGPRSAVFIFQSVAITGILALGVTCTLVVGGFDLSIGSVATSSMMLSAYMMVVLEQSAFVAIIACLAMGAFIGLVNGLLDRQDQDARICWRHWA